MEIVYLNGEFVAKENANISIMDRGLLFGDSVYEVVPVYHSKPFRLSQHLQRLQQSLDAIRIQLTIDENKWQDIVQQLVVHNQQQQQDITIYLQITRGATPLRQHGISANITPTIFAFTMPLTGPPLAKLQQGMKAITVEDTRWEKCNIKANILLANVLLYQQAKDTGADEAILIRDGMALEGSSSNLFILKNGLLKTPPLSEALLGGITREVILELAKKNKISCQETPIKKSELFEADEIWLTSSSKPIYPIVQLDDKKIGNGEVGTVWQQIIQDYYQYIKKDS